MIRPAIISPMRLGFIPTEKRSVKSMPQWAKDLVPKPVGKNETVKGGNEDVEADTMPLIKSKVYRTLYHTKKLAARLEGDTLQETTATDWKFVFDYVRYVKDSPGAEEVRSPRRTIHESKGDCDCMTTLLSSLLINQGIPHFMRIIKQNGAYDWSHIYIVVPISKTVSKKLTDRSQYIVMDCVTNKFDYEPPFTEKKDFPMALQYLDGIKEASGYGTLNGMGACEDKKPLINRVRNFVYTQSVLEQGLVPAKQFLDSNKIAYVPAVNEQTQSGSFIVQTPQGVKNVPSVISKQEADSILQSLSSLLPASTNSAQPTTQQLIDNTKQAAADATDKITAKAMTINPKWWLLVLGGGALLLLASAKKSAVETAASGLSGIKKTSRRAKSPKKKIKTLYIN